MLQIPQNREVGRIKEYCGRNSALDSCKIYLPNPEFLKSYTDALTKSNIHKPLWLKGTLINCLPFKKKVTVTKNLLAAAIKGLCNLKVINGSGSDLKVKVLTLYIILCIKKKRSTSLYIHIHVFITSIFNWLTKAMSYRR